VAIDVGFASESDSYGAESPCVVKTPGGYLMAYGGSDGEISRLHMATSEDSHRWDAQGTIMQRGPEDAGGANHPCPLGYPGFESPALEFTSRPVVSSAVRGRPLPSSQR